MTVRRLAASVPDSTIRSLLVLDIGTVSQFLGRFVGLILQGKGPSTFVKPGLPESR